MSADQPTILATSMGFRGTGRNMLDWEPGPVFRLAAELANAVEAPRICYLGQATGDPDDRRAGWYGAFVGTEFQASHLALFAMPNVSDMRAHLLAQDIIWVGGGSVANLCAIWRVHDLQEILHEAWQAGVVMAGVSAGSICWHVGGSTDSYGPELRGFTDGLAWLPYSNGVHYDGEDQRRPMMHKLIGDGTLPDGYATDDGAGLIYHGTELAEAVADREGKFGYRLTRNEDGTVTETVLPTRLLSY
jgi:peptidase E